MEITAQIRQLLQEGKITEKTIERVNIAKSYIEQKYSTKKIQEESKNKDWEKIIQKLSNLNIPLHQKEALKTEFLHKEAEYMRLKRQKMTIYDFEPLSIIGRGAFGEVRICRHKKTNEIVAVKKMNKTSMAEQKQLMHIRTERDILTYESPWIVNLKYSFQDEYYLYLVMDYCPGGDLMNLLIQKEILTEEEGRFYIAEMILSVEEVHKINCIHRDLKPDNILIDKDGHIKLSDFGLAKISDQKVFPMTQNDQITIYNKLNQQEITNSSNNIFKNNINNINNFRKQKRLLAYSTVGTPDYIAPEVFGTTGYGKEIDWWSIGVMFFEMVVGFPPFYSDNNQETCIKIKNWKKFFRIPKEANLSNEATNLILGLMNDADKRLGKNGAKEIKNHPFFTKVNFDWDNIRKMKPPFIPKIKNDWDNRYFEHFDEEQPFYPPESKHHNKRKDIDYAGYTFNRDYESLQGGFSRALEVLDVFKKKMEDKERDRVINKGRGGRMANSQSHRGNNSNNNSKDNNSKDNNNKNNNGYSGLKFNNYGLNNLNTISNVDNKEHEKKTHLQNFNSSSSIVCKTQYSSHTHKTIGSNNTNNTNNTNSSNNTSKNFEDNKENKISNVNYNYSNNITNCNSNCNSNNNSNNINSINLNSTTTANTNIIPNSNPMTNNNKLEYLPPKPNKKNLVPKDKNRYGNCPPQILIKKASRSPQNYNTKFKPISSKNVACNMGFKCSSSNRISPGKGQLVRGNNNINDKLHFNITNSNFIRSNGNNNINSNRLGQVHFLNVNNCGGGFSSNSCSKNRNVNNNGNANINNIQNLPNNMNIKNSFIKFMKRKTYV